MIPRVNAGYSVFMSKPRASGDDPSQLVLGDALAP